jgi:long-chain acyl-CoA synthetase
MNGSAKAMSNPLSLDTDASIPSAFYRVASEFPQALVYRQAASSSEPARQANFAEVRARVNRISSYLKSMGIGKGSCVAILSQTRPEWLEADLAILACGAVVVSIYQTLPAQDVGYILFDSAADIVFAENQEQVSKLFHLLSEPCSIPATEERAAQHVQVAIRKIVSFESVEPHEKVISWRSLLDIADPGMPTFEYIQRDDLASLVYTSGTTGPPKGVMQTHGNHLSNVRQAFQSTLYDGSSRIFLLLPLAHSFARLMGYICFLTTAELAFPGIADQSSSKTNPAAVMKDLREANATIVPLVPRLIEKMRDGVEAQALSGGLKGLLLSSAIGAARRVYEARRLSDTPVVFDLLLSKLLSPIVRKIGAKLFGSQLCAVISGGAKLPSAVAHYFAALGVPVLEGYGLTETCVATNVNRLVCNRIGSVGPLLAADIELRLESDGEICFRGPNITRGYFKRQAATAAAWDEQGWFHTGDLGSVDGEGNLSIIGRKKEIIVSSNGKKVAPDPIEQKLTASRYINQAVLFGDDRPYCVALLYPDPIAVQAWAVRQGLHFALPLHLEPAVQELLWAEVEAVNAGIAGFERVRRILLIPEEMTVDNSLLTPTFKIRRKEVARHFAGAIAKLYEEKLT